MKPSRLREAALHDIDAALAHYLRVAPQMLEDFQAAILCARSHIELHPGTGSPRYGNTPKSRRLRFWLADRFPYALFYTEQPLFIDIIRVLHTASDIPAHLRA